MPRMHILAFLTKKGPSRNPITREQLQSAITDAVRKSDPDCEPFVGVVIARAAQLGVASNWTIRGVKFGKADREKSNQALKSIVERMQLEFVISEEGPKAEKDKASPSKKKLSP
jgi:hypothetical protein